MADFTGALNHLVGPTHSLPPWGLDQGMEARPPAFTDLTRIPGPSPGDLANGPLGPDFWVVSVPGPLVSGPPIWPLVAPGPPPGALFAHDPGQVQEWEPVFGFRHC